jgi:hypothetical protein
MTAGIAKRYIFTRERVVGNGDVAANRACAKFTSIRQIRPLQSVHSGLSMKSVGGTADKRDDHASPSAVARCPAIRA